MYQTMYKTELNDGLNLTNPKAENTNATSESCTKDQVEQISNEKMDSDQDNAKRKQK